MENKNRLSLSTSLWKKISRVAGKAGVKVVYAALALYYVTRDGAVPTFTKLKIYGALAYFIMPVDLIPDFIIGLGFADDLAALTWAFFEVQKHITPEIDRKVMTKLREWFGDFDSSKLDSLRTNRGEPIDIDVDVEVH